MSSPTTWGCRASECLDYRALHHKLAPVPAIGRFYQGSVHPRISRRMTGAAHNDEFTVWPRLGEFPC
jgi:hypothetical protein